MTHTFKIRYANVLVGFFVLTVLAMLIVGTFFVGSKKKWFEDPLIVEGHLPYRRTLGLVPGTSVMLMDAVVGEVSEIHYHQNGYVTVDLTLNPKLTPFLRTNAVGIVRKEFAVVGERRIVLEQKEEGPTYAELNEPPHLKISPDVDVVAKLLYTVDRITADLPRLVSDGRSTVSNVCALTGQMADPQKGIQATLVETTQLLARMREMVEKASSGDGTVAKILNDPQFANDFQRIASELGSTLKEVRGTLVTVQDMMVKDVRPVLGKVDGLAGSVTNLLEESRPLVRNAATSMEKIPDTLTQASGVMRSMPELISDVNAALGEVNLLLRGLQHHWLFRSGVEKAKQEERESLSVSPELLVP